MGVGFAERRTAMSDPSKRQSGEAGVKIYPSGVIVFVVVCVLMAAALSNPQYMAIASASATVLIALGIAGLFFPSLIRKGRGL
jgi:cytochrome c-type biogenesis protein CcmH/NrfG